MSFWSDFFRITQKGRFFLCNFGKKSIPEIHCESRGLLLFIVPNPDEVAGLAGGVPGDVEPAGAGEELVGDQENRPRDPPLSCNCFIRINASLACFICASAAASIFWACVLSNSAISCPARIA